MKKNVVAIPIETKVRELNGKLLLGYKLAQKGFKSVIGVFNSIDYDIDKIKPNLYIGGNANPSEDRAILFDKLHASGCYVTVLENEGAIVRSYKDHSWRHSEEILGKLDYFMCWGEVAKEFMSTEYKAQTPAEKVFISGYPPLDFTNKTLRTVYQAEADQIKKENGDFILVNTNFGRHNPYNYLTVARPVTPDESVFFEAIMSGLVEVVHTLSKKYPDLNIVLRPHPSENHDYYRKEFKDLKNVSVKHEGSVYSWLLACKAIIHNGCTTGVEGVLMDRNVIAYRPHVDERFDLPLPNMVSLEAFNMDELLKLVEECLAREEGQRNVTQEQVDTLSKYIINAKESSTDLVANFIDSLEMRPYVINKEHDKWTNSKKAHHISKYPVVRELMYALRPSVKQGHNYLKQKFPGLKIHEVEEGIERFKKIYNDDSKYIVKHIPGTKEVYSIEKA